MPPPDPNPAPSTRPLPQVTVVVIHGRWEGSRLHESLKAQTCPAWTASLLPNTQRTADAADGRSIADRVRAGVENAATPYILLASADTQLDPTYVEKCLWFLWTHRRYAFINSHERRTAADGSRTVSRRAFFDADAVTSSFELGLHVMARSDALREVQIDVNDGPAAIWSFWLRCAEKDLWGSTIAETLLDRPAGPAYGDLDPATAPQHIESLRSRFPRSFQGRLPVIEPRWPKAFDAVGATAPAAWTLPRRLATSSASADPRVPSRLLLIAPWLRMGGADKFNLDLCRMLRARGCELTIACTAPSPDGWYDQFHELTADIFRPHLFLHWSDYPALLRSLIATRRPDVVLVSNSELGYHLIPYFRASHPEPLYLDYVHMEEDDWKNGGHARHSVGLHDQLDRTLVTSLHLASWMTARGSSRSRIDVCPIGVDHTLWTADPAARERVRRELAIPADEPVILFAGRVCAQKQPQVLSRTFELLAERGTAFTALVAGDGEDLPWLRNHLSAHALTSRVRLLGDVPPDRVRELMQGADIFFLPSKWEGVALVLYEAMSAGTIFVGASVGGQAEVGTPDSCVLITPSGDPFADAQRYADEIASLLADQNRMRRMAETARRRIESSYTYELLLDRFLASIAAAKHTQRTDPRQRLTPSFAQELAVRAVEQLRLEWQEGLLWREREYWKSAASRTVTEDGLGKRVLRKVLRAMGKQG